MPKLIVKKGKISIITQTIVIHQHFYKKVKDYYSKKKKNLKYLLKKNLY